MQGVRERLGTLEDGRLPALERRLEDVAAAGPSQVRRAARIWLARAGAEMPAHRA